MSYLANRRKHFRAFNYLNETLSANNNWTARGDRDTNFLFSSGDLVSQWNDLGSDGEDFGQTVVSSSPILYTSGVNSINNFPAVTSDGTTTDFLEVSSITPFNFLHNGTIPYTIVTVFKPYGLYGNLADVCTPFATTYSSSNNGFRLFMVGATNAGSKNQSNLWIMNSGAIVGYVGSSLDALVQENLNILIIRFDGSRFSMDLKNTTGYFKSIGGVVSSFSLANSDRKLRTHTLNNPNVDKIAISDMQIWKEYKNDGWTINALNWLYNYYN
jgi:hypothetical protein